MISQPDPQLPTVRTSMTVLDPKRLHRLHNARCAYCHEPFGKARVPTDDHVLGRRFVPKGSLSASINLVVRACEKCNGLKAGLESDLSAISMQPDTWGQLAAPAKELQAEAKRKASVPNPYNGGQPVSSPSPPLSISAPIMPGLNATFQFKGPAQPDPERVLLLASMHVSAFFFLTTFSKQTRMGSALPGIFYLDSLCRRKDWGNQRLRTFANVTKSWLPRVSGTMAEGYFRVATWREPSLGDIWAWALEWNKQLRMTGYFGREDLVAGAAAGLPPLLMDEVPGADGAMFRFREEVSLAPENDILFDLAKSQK